MYCRNCGTELQKGVVFCPICGAAVTAPSAVRLDPLEYDIEVEGQEHTVPGDAKIEDQQHMPRKKTAAEILGALLGAILGGSAIVMMGGFGFIAAISGLILVVCTFGGCALLGKGIGKVGYAVCLMCMLIVPYVSDRIDWALLVMEEFEGTGFGEAYRAVPMLIKQNAIEFADYVMNLIPLYMITLAGAISAYITLRKKQKNDSE